MKKALKLKSVKPGHKGITKAPLFKKPKSTGKLILPKQVEIDENVVKKTKVELTQMKLEKINKKEKSEKKTKNKNFQKNSVSKVKPDLKPGKAHSKKILVVDDLKQKISNSSKELTVPDQAQKKSPKKILPSKYITDEIATKAVISLQKLAEQQKKNKIFEEECAVLAQINCIKIQSRKTTIKINLPHSTAASTGEVCLITTDLKKGRKHDHEPSVDHWEDVLRKAGVTQIKTLLPMRQLRVEYDQFELKRRLLTQHDFILVDSRIHGHVCHILGKTFQNKHNMLIPVRLHDVKDIKKSIEASLNMSLLHVSDGLTSSVTIGHMGMSTKQLKDNILGLVKELAKKYPGGEHNIRSLHVKLPLSLALPLYVTLRSKKTISIPKVHSVLPKNYKTVEGELTTILGSTVKITPDGNISLKRNADELESENEDEQEELSENEEVPKPKNKKQKTKKAVKGNKETHVQGKDDTQEMDSENDAGSDLELTKDSSDDNAENGKDSDSDKEDNIESENELDDQSDDESDSE